MARVSNAVKAKYDLLNEDPNVCYYCCSSEAIMDDLSPHPSATEFDKSAFPEKWTRARVCRPCWSRIYFMNIVNGGGPGIRKGAMTVEQKRELIQKNSRPTQKGAFVIGFGNTLIVPPGMLQIDEHRYGLGSETFYREEILELQGAMAIKTLGLPDSSVEVAIASGMASGNLDIERMDVYRKLLELS